MVQYTKYFYFLSVQADTKELIPADFLYTVVSKMIQRSFI